MTQHNRETLIVPITLNRVPMAHALIWLRNAFKLIQAQPMVLILATTWMVFLQMLLATILPGVGTMLFLIIAPALAFGIADVCQTIRLQEPASPLAIFSPLGHSVRNQLLGLGMIFAVILFGLLLLTQNLLDFSSLDEIVKKIGLLQQQRDIDTIRTQTQEILALILQQKKLLLVFAALSIASIVIQILLIYAPLFTVWQNIHAPQAAWLSIKVILKNLLPVLLVGIVITGGFALLVLLLSAIALHSPFFLMLTSMASWIGLNTLINALTYTSYYDIIKHSLTNSVHESINQILEQPNEKPN